MRKNYLMFLLALLATVAVMAQPKKVAYITLNKTMDATATTVDNDPVIQVLKADPNITLTVKLIASNEVIDDLASYDAIVVQESIGGAADVLKPAGSLGLAKIPVPFVYNKAYALQSGRALTSGAAAAESNSLTITVESGALTNDLFKACTISGTNQIALLKVLANDLGATAESGVTNAVKSLNYNANPTISNQTLLAQPTGVTNAAVAINDMPAGTVINSETLISRMITISMNFGAMSANGGTNMTDDGLTLWRNAVYIAAGLPVPSTKATLPTSVAPIQIDAEVISVQYFNINGIEVQRPADMNKGLYIQRTGYSDGRVVTSKVVMGR